METEQRRRGRIGPSQALVIVSLVLAVVLAGFVPGFLAGRTTSDGRSASGGPAGDELGSQSLQDLPALGSEPVADPGDVAPPGPGGSEPVVGQAGLAGPDPIRLVAAYRSNLAAEGLDSGQLSDEDLLRFGSGACVLATSAETVDDFDRFRSAAMAQAETSLSGTEMALAVNVAIASFCPAEATRLGL